MSPETEKPNVEKPLLVIILEFGGFSYEKLLQETNPCAIILFVAPHARVLTSVRRAVREIRRYAEANVLDTVLREEDLAGDFEDDVMRLLRAVRSPIPAPITVAVDAHAGYALRALLAYRVAYHYIDYVRRRKVVFKLAEMSEKSLKRIGTVLSSLREMHAVVLGLILDMRRFGTATTFENILDRLNKMGKAVSREELEKTLNELTAVGLVENGEGIYRVKSPW